jgi:basic membrane protein A and related proteins
LMLSQTACGDDEKNTPAKITKAAWIYISQIGDGGWTYAHNQGRLQVEADLENVETSYVENIPDTDIPASEAAIRAAAEAGPDIIFTTSYGYMDPTATVAPAFPDIKFEHCSGYKDGPNFVNYFGRIEQARYLTGIVAGRMTTNHKVGYVAAFPIPEVFRGINAFTLGARTVDPSITVYVHWTHTWYGPTEENAGAVALITNQGVDIITQHQDTTAPILAARDAGIYAIGYDTDMLAADPDTVLTSAIWHWGPYYSKRVKAVQDGTWAKENYWGGMNDGIVGLGQYGAMVGAAVKTEVTTAQAAITAGTLNIWAGPITKADDSVWVAAGSAIADGDQLGMMDIVKGVVETNAR